MSAQRKRDAFEFLLSTAVDRDSSRPGHVSGTLGPSTKKAIAAQLEADGGRIGRVLLHEQMCFDGAAGRIPGLEAGKGISGDFLCAQVEELAAAGASVLLLSVDSPGGVIEEGELVIEALQRFQRAGRVVAHVSGRADSMAAPVARIADVVVAAPGSTYLLHRAHGTAAPAELRAADRRVGQVLIERTLLTEEKIRELHQGAGTRLSASEALAYGLVDQIGDAAAAWAEAVSLVNARRKSRPSTGVDTMKREETFSTLRRRIALEQLDERIGKISARTEEMEQRLKREQARALALSPGPLETKRVGRPLAVQATADAGVFEGYGAVFDTKHPTSSWTLGSDWSDVIRPGAFSKSLAEHKKIGSTPLMLLMHEPGAVIGAWISVSEDRDGLKVSGLVSPRAMASARVPVLELLRLGALTGLSIGFRAVKVALNDATKTRELLEIDLHEVSVVDEPASPVSRITDVKSHS